MIEIYSNPNWQFIVLFSHQKDHILKIKMDEKVVTKTEPLDLKNESNDVNLDQINISRFDDPVDPDLDLIEPKFENCENLFKESETEVPENLVENGEKNKPFICASCDKGFALKQYLTEHIKSVHEGWKLCPCSICDGKFIYSSELESHQRAVHEKKNFTSSQSVISVVD